ncbi:hypothetical protein DL89DRAFT_264361 [Linderina pennispora]|uniref:Uncharacterized protein n=1 Tax=Linderina pennispora TaxID=61395 RepID=A0A1Y1WLX8_9FUNG|nr:uncharacterized protein DL89DRAFT_264361 [Linderina pennispora]ORX74502.1 hypothetical protein DL89DRAFT_264361 [Linderina pennispora]
MDQTYPEHIHRVMESSQIADYSSRAAGIFGFGVGVRNDEQPQTQQPTEPVGRQGNSGNAYYQIGSHYPHQISRHESSGKGNHRNDHSEVDEFGMLHLVHEYLATQRGTRGTHREKMILTKHITRLSNDPRMLEIAGLAFFATLDNAVFPGNAKFDTRIRHVYGSNDGEGYNIRGRLDDIYNKYKADVFAFEHLAPETSVLDTRTFGDHWLPNSGRNRPYETYHWYINSLDCLIPDAMSETFQLHGVKCKLRLLKKFSLSNGETWTGLWLHNVGRGRDVINGPFVLAISNVAYPTEYHAQVVLPKGGVRPSQGVGMKLFVEYKELLHSTHKNSRPICDSDGRVRVSVISI